MFIAKVIASLVGFITTAQLIRSLGGESASSYFFLIAVISVLTAVSSLGSPDAILKTVAINKEATGLVKKVVVVVCSISIAASLALTLIVFVITRFVHLSNDGYLWLSVLTVLPMATIVLVLASAIQGKGYVVCAMIISGLFQNSIVLVSLFTFADSYGEVVQVFAFANLLACLFAYLLLKGDWRDKTSDFDWRRFKSTCSSMLVTQCVTQYNNNSAILLLGFLWVGSDISIIAISLKIATLLGFIIISVNKVVAPQIARIYKNSNLDELQKIITKSTRLMWGLCLPAVLIMLFF
ncbi:hypothetical protein JF50_04090 [Pseudoalteromonas luteoviolacea]|uniref:Oligosaccharide flippase family protein n=1 Tax=Pseudoalteromonas luteoviolacea TaxID=43657 RepID=A0A0C1QSE8_9GAMM|nr:hypothetical protein JF50_04090 [Pseudoalteromonas luteoviolacea]